MPLFPVGAVLLMLRDMIGGAAAKEDAREILSAILEVPRSWPSTHLEEQLPHAMSHAALSAGQKRAKGMPVQYAVGKAPFRHLILDVDQRVLIPRPETEVLVDLVLKMAPKGTVADVCTGSGAIAIALATEGGYDRVVATDVSAEALEVARANADRFATGLNGKLEFREGSMLAPLGSDRFDAIVSNPPYIASAEMDSLPPEVRDWEPHLALVSGDDGLDAVREIAAGAPALLKPGGLLALEVDSRRADAAADILRAEKEYDEIQIRADLTGRPRFVSGFRR